MPKRDVTELCQKIVLHLVTTQYGFVVLSVTTRFSIECVGLDVNFMLSP